MSQQVRLLVHPNGLEPPLEQMAATSMSPIGGLGQYAVELSHALGKIALGRFDNGMVMVGHLTEGMTDRIESFTDSSENLKPCLAIPFAKIDSLAAVAP